MNKLEVNFSEENIMRDVCFFAVSLPTRKDNPFHSVPWLMCLLIADEMGGNDEGEGTAVFII